MASRLKFLVCLVFLLHAVSNSVLAQNRMVFAHYMLWAPSSSDDVAGFKSEIQYAQSKGIDAFALNTNVWADFYRKRADQIYQAAQELGSGFKIFFSLDMHRDGNGFLSAGDVNEMLTRYASSPSQLFFNGKQFVSSWLGSEDGVFDGYSDAVDGWSKAVFEPTGGRNKYFFLPFFVTDGSESQVSSMLNRFSSVLDGLYAWDTSAWPFDDPQSPSDSKDRAYLAACNKAGKSYMASISPWFLSCTDTGNCNCQVKGNYKGPGLWLTRWAQLISSPPPFLEVVTWNDWAERTYVAPINSPPFGPQSFNDGDFPHEAFLELGSHYINWYKTGSQPSITADSLYIFYYSQSKSVTGSCQVQKVDTLDDRVYVASVLTAPGQVTVSSGGSSQTFPVDQGIQVVSIPMQEGQQAATLTRNGAQSLRVVGSKPVSNSVSKNDFNVYSGFSK